MVCQGFRPPPDFRPELLRDLLANAVTDSAAAAPFSTLAERQLIPFLACGDLSGWDADQSCDLPSADYKPLPPVAEPTNPAYREAIEQRRDARTRGGLSA